MDLMLDIVSSVLLLTGGFFVFVGGFGVMRMPEFYTRMHAASLTDTGGAALILIGLMVQGGFTLIPLKLAAIFLFLFLTSPTASYALANAALLSGLKPGCRNETGKAFPSDQSTGATPKQKSPPVQKTAAEKPAAKKATANKAAAKKVAAKKTASKAAPRKPAKKAAKKPGRKKSR